MRHDLPGPTSIAGRRDPTQANADEPVPRRAEKRSVAIQPQESRSRGEFQSGVCQRFAGRQPSTRCIKGISTERGNGENSSVFRRICSD